MKLKIAILPAALAAVLSSAAAAQTKLPKPVSPFILCDGRTGHVGLGETLGRLIAITATAGLSEAATAKDDGTRKLSGESAAKACETALTLEGDPLRRMQLGMAQSIHLIEAGRLDDAFTVAQGIGALGGALGREWSYRRTLEPRVLLLQAEIMVRRKDIVGAQDAAIRALQAAPYDVALLRRAQRYLLLGGPWNTDKATVLQQAVRLMPETLFALVDAALLAGRLDEAATYLAAMNEGMIPFFVDFHPEQLDVNRALVLQLNGDTAASAGLAAKTEASLAALAPTGFAVQNASAVATMSETLGLRAILAQAAGGQTAEARATFRAHGPWLLVNKSMLLLAVDKLRAGAPAAELTGTLAEPSDTIRKRRQAEMLAAFADEDLLVSHYQQADYFAKESAFAGAANATWKVGVKPKFLRPAEPKQLAGTEVLSTLPNVDGLPAGEAVLLHAALIARSRNQPNIMLKPGRQYVGVVALRFGTAGQPGMPAVLALDAATVIADLSPHIPQPLPK